MAFDILVNKNATVDDTLRLIVNAVNVCKNSPFVQKIVQELGPVSNKEVFIKKLFDWICRNAKYKLDVPGIEEVWTPEKVIREGTYDCKKISVLISSVLQAAGIESILKHVYYSGTDGSLKDYTHIYVIVPNPDEYNYITVDPTNDCKYDSEVQSSKQTLYYLNGKKMELHMMGRPYSTGAAQPANPVTLPYVPDTSCFRSVVNATACQLESQMMGASNYGNDTIAGSNQYFSYTLAEEVKHIAAVPLLSAPRAAFLGLLYLGKLLANTPIKLNLARWIAFAWNANPNGFRKLWWSLGGEADASVIQTALKKIVGGVIYGPPGNRSYDRPWIIQDVSYGHSSVNGYGYGIGNSIGQGPATLAAIATATPVIALVLKYLTDNKIIKNGQTDPPVDPSTPVIIPDDGTKVPDDKGNPNPTAGSFALHSIDTIWDFLDFIKASAIIVLATSAKPILMIPVNICLGISLLYALRKKIFS